MKVVAVDTATAFGSVALVEDDALLGEVRLEGAQSSSTRLLPAVDSLLDRLGLGVGDLDGFGVAIGPGSYTGLRVGIGSVQGLAFASGKRCAGVCVLDALARRMRGSATMLVPLMDAYRHEVYAARYDRDARPLSDPVAREPAAFVSELPDSPAFLGDGAVKYRSLIERLRPNAVFPERDLYLAEEIGRLTVETLREGRDTPPARLRPLYVRGVDIRRSTS